MSLDLRDIISDDTNTLLADFGEAALYHARNQGDGEAVTVRVTSRADRQMQAKGMGNLGGFTNVQKWRLLVKALAVNESIEPTANVGEAGGVRELLKGDGFTVPASMLDKSAQTTGYVRVIVQGDIRRVGGHWSCEVRP